MGLYQRYLLPRILHLSMKSRDITRWRAQIIPAARGRVLEIGIGSGLNLPFYGAEVTELAAVDPSRELLRLAGRAAAQTDFEVDLRAQSAERLPFDEAGFDCLVTTWTLCSIPDVSAALADMRRVLKPDGRLIFIEHGSSPEPRVRRWQDRLNPLWNRCAGGCNLNRDIESLIGRAGFRITELETGHLVKGPRPLTYHYRGLARPA